MATGSRAYVLSHYRRILAVNWRILGRNFWLILHENANARLAWRLTGFCKSMLAHPGSTAPEDEARRHFHPSLEGPRVLAEVSWNAGPVAG